MQSAVRWLCLVVLVISLSACGGGGSGEVEDTSGDPTAMPDLPTDTGGTQTAVLHGTTTSPYGHYVYVPGGYDPDGPAYPLLIFLHGLGEKGDSSTNPAILDKVLVHGPSKLIKNGDWNPSIPMIVTSPQSPVWWNSATIDDFIDYMRSTYMIDETRIYMTGLSMGGMGTFDYLTNMGASGQVAAAVPICGKGATGKADQMLHVPVWAFHGDADGTVNANGSITMINAINALNPPVRAKLTLYPGVGHNSWARTYNGSGMGTERDDWDAFDESIFEWMLRYRMTP